MSEPVRDKIGTSRSPKAEANGHQGGQMNGTRGTRIVLWGLTAIGVVVFMEVVSFVVLSLFSGEVVSWGDIARKQQMQGKGNGAGTVQEQAPAPDDDEELKRRRWREYKIVVPKTVHPYLGYVTDPEDYERAGRTIRDAEAADHGFPQNGWPLFLEADEERVVVVVLGGSFADQLATHFGSLRPALQETERFQRRRVVVISLAQPGYKQPQQLMALNYFLSLGMHADIVINVDGFNDVALAPVSVIPWGGFPFFPRGWPAAVGHLDPALRRAIGELSYLRDLRARRAGAFSRVPWRYSMVCGLLWSRLDHKLRGRIAAAEQAMLKLNDSADESFQARGPRRQYASEEEMYQDLVVVWQRCSEQMHLLCTGLGIEYHHFLQPNQYLPGSKPLGPEERRRAWRVHHPYRPSVEQGYPMLRAAGARLQQRGVAFYDFSMLFEEEEETLYEDACCHLNQQGRMLVAAAIASIVDASAEQGSD